MSAATATSVRRPVPGTGALPAGTTAVVVAGCGLLAARAWLPPTSGPARPLIGLVLFGAVLVASATAAAWTLPLSLLAAVAEEALFRRVAYRGLVRHGVPAAVIGSAVLFALVHVPLYGVAVLPVDLGAGLVFGWQRWATGSWTVPAATHAAANLVAVLR